MRNTKGITLTELMIVSAIIGVLFTLSFPLVNRTIARGRLKDAARDLYFDMQTVRMRAIKENRAFAIQFDASGNSYKVIRDRGVDGQWNTADDEVLKSVGLAASFKGVSIGSNAGKRPGETSSTTTVSFASDNRVQYNADGTVQAEDATGTVYLKNDKETFAVGTTNASGKVKMWRSYDGVTWDPPTD